MKGARSASPADRARLGWLCSAIATVAVSGCAAAPQPPLGAMVLRPVAPNQVILMAPDGMALSIGDVSREGDRTIANFAMPDGSIRHCIVTTGPGGVVTEATCP